MEEKKLMDEKLLKELHKDVEIYKQDFRMFGDYFDIERLEQAIDLINRQQAEIDRLQGELGCYIADQGILLQKIERLTEEYNKLSNEWDATSKYACRLGNENDKLTDELRLYKDANKSIKKNAAELQKRVKNLTEERDKYQEKWRTSYMNELNLQKQVDECNRDCEEYAIENGELQKQVNELTEELSNVPDPFPCKIGSGCESAGKACYDCPNNRYREQTVKDTAKEIMDVLAERKERVKSFYGVAESVGVDIAINTIKEILKQKGVEVE